MEALKRELGYAGAYLHSVNPTLGDWAEQGGMESATLDPQVIMALAFHARRLGLQPKTWE